MPTKYGASHNADSLNRHTFPVESEFGRTRRLEIYQKRQNAANRRDANAGWRVCGDYYYPGNNTAEWPNQCRGTNSNAAYASIYNSANNRYAHRCKYARTNKYTNRNGYAHAVSDANEYKYAVAHEYAHMDSDAKPYSHSSAYAYVGALQYAYI